MHSSLGECTSGCKLIVNWRSLLLHAFFDFFRKNLTKSRVNCCLMSFSTLERHLWYVFMLFWFVYMFKTVFYIYIVVFETYNDQNITNNENCVKVTSDVARTKAAADAGPKTTNSEGSQNQSSNGQTQGWCPCVDRLFSAAPSSRTSGWDWAIHGFVACNLAYIITVQEIGCFAACKRVDHYKNDPV